MKNLIVAVLVILVFMGTIYFMGLMTWDGDWDIYDQDSPTKRT